MICGFYFKSILMSTAGTATRAAANPVCSSAGDIAYNRSSTDLATISGAGQPR